MSDQVMCHHIADLRLIREKSRKPPAKLFLIMSIMRLINRIDKKAHRISVNDIDIAGAHLGLPGRLKHGQHPVSLRHIPIKNPLPHQSGQLPHFRKLFRILMIPDSCSHRFQRLPVFHFN